MRSARSVVQIVRGHDLILDAFIIKLNAMLGVVALEDVQVLDGELVILIPANSQSLVFALALLLGHFGGVEQIEHLLVVYLQERARYCYVLAFLLLFRTQECLSDGADAEAVLRALEVAYHGFAGSLIWVVLRCGRLVLIAFHGKSLAATGLAVGKDGGVEAVNHLLD